MERDQLREYKNVRQFTVIAPTGGFQTDGKLAFGMDAAAMPTP